MSKAVIQKSGQKNYKYKIDDLSKLARYELDITMQALCDLISIPKKTFERDRKILIGHTADIPMGRIRQYAQFFEVEIINLCNEPVEQKGYTTYKDSTESENPTTELLKDFNL